MQAKITMSNGEQQGRTIPLQIGKEHLIIGRSPKCWLPIKDSKISGNHCEIEFQDDRFWVKDLGSTNGTFVNNKQIDRVVLNHQDVIQVGKSMLRFEVIAEAEPAKKVVYTEMTEVFDQDESETSHSQTIGNYRILEKISESPRLTIYKAEHTVLKNIIILKVFPCPKIVQTGLQQQIVQELSPLKKLRHDGIISLYDVFWHQDKLVLVNDYVPGKTVQQLLEEKVNVSWKKAIRIVFYIAVSLEHTHSRGLQHGSLTSENVILEEGTKLIKISDFSLMNILQKYQLSHVNWVAESSIYQPHSNHVEKFSQVSKDLYSLGCILVFLLMGKIPEKIQPNEWIKSLPSNSFPAGIVTILNKTLLEPSYSSARECYQEIAKIAKESQNA